MKKIFIPLIVLLTIFISCQNNAEFSESIAYNGHWNRYDTAVFTVDIADTLNPHMFYINIRNNNDYNFSNLYVFLHTTLPRGEQMIDTIECILANKEGEWLGNGIGNIKENDILLQNGLVFPQKGQYKFAIEQAMRVEDLAGIEDIGIRIAKLPD